MDLAYYAHDRTVIMKYVDDKVAAIVPFNPASILTRVAALESGKEDVGAYNGAITGLSISVALIQV
jgi:hypothetical protein